jgi:lycopene cyclase CruA
MLDHIRNTHPLVFQYFSALQDGERQLRSILAIDRYWENLGLPVPEVIRDGSRLPADARIEESFDLLYAGGTLGLLHAAVMAKRYGRKVLLIDRVEPGRTTRDWNISRTELMRLADTGVFTQAELDSTIVRTYKTGWVEFHAPAAKRKRLYMDEVLDCAVDADKLLGFARDKVLASGESKVLGHTSFVSCYRFPDHLVVQAERSDGKQLFFKAEVLVDAMGIVSPVAMQLNQGRPQTHVCPTVGTIASGFEGVDFEVGEILASTEDAEVSGRQGRQLIWEGFPAKGDEYITYLFFYDRVDSPNDKTLLGLFEAYFRKLPEYKTPGAKFTIHRPVYGIIPAYFHDGAGCTRAVSDERIALLGDAASLASPLTFCGFGSVVRNLDRMTSGLDRAMREGRLGAADLARISAYEPNVASMANLMKYMCYDPETDKPGFVNEMMNEVMIVLDELPPRYRQAMFRDEMKVEELVTVMLKVAWRYPRILKATWEKLGVGGSVGFVKNLAGWAIRQASKQSR